MSGTIVEKILENHLIEGQVKPGAIITADIDLMIANELSMALALDIFGTIKQQTIKYPERFALVTDHVTPNKDITSANLTKRVKEFAESQHIEHFYPSGEGIEHILFPERGLIKPGATILGGDSHTCTYGALNAFAAGIGSTDLARWFVDGRAWLRVPETIKIILNGKIHKDARGKDLALCILQKLGLDGANYKSLEYTGSAIKNLTMAGRFTVANMATETGAKNCFCEIDSKTVNFLKEVGIEDFINVKADSNAEYEDVLEFNVKDLPAMISQPSQPSNVVEVSEIQKKKIKIQQVYIGSCTNGHYEDLEDAARILRDNKVKKGVRCIIVPGSRRIYVKALEKGIISDFIRAGCIVSEPTCGACLGSFKGVLADNEVCVSTTNRNFVGRMGAKSSQIYLVNPLVAAASAIAGQIITPEKL